MQNSAVAGRLLFNVDSMLRTFIKLEDTLNTLKMQFTLFANLKDIDNIDV